MTILVSGKNGQLGHCLVDRLNFSDLDYISLDKKEMDITKYDETARIIGEIKPRVIINTAAYTDVAQSACAVIICCVVLLNVPLPSVFSYHATLLSP